jgi:glucosamine--fructose-6-phosphate aminotransferase (isomerizing)
LIEIVCLGVASTKAYTSQFLALSEDSISKQTRRDDIFDGLQKLPELIKEVLKCDKTIRDFAEDLYKKTSLLVMGRGFNFATCLEGALVRLNILFFFLLKFLCIILIEF